jgi:hypothetical protein
MKLIFHRIPWNCMEFSMKFGIPWNFMKLRLNEFLGIPWNSMELFHGIP